LRNVKGTDEVANANIIQTPSYARKFMELYDYSTVVIIMLLPPTSSKNNLKYEPFG
jgi:hypothetical protein